MNHTKKVLATVAVIAATVVGLSACSAAAKSNSPAVKSTLTVAIENGPTSLDYLALDTSYPTYIWTALYDQLLWINGSGKIQPGAAQSYTYSAGNTVLTLKLRSGMKFSNGDAVTAADVKKDLTEFKAKGNYASTLESVQTIDAPNSTTVVLHLSAPDPSLLYSLGRNAGAVADPKTIGTAANKLDPVGSGPYTLDTAKTTAGSTYTLERNPSYWGVKQFPYKTVVFKVLADTTATLNALKTGEVESGAVDSTTVAQAKASGLTIGTSPGASFYALFIFDRAGSKVPALGSLKVRQAINYALDRPAFVSSLLHGLGKPTEQMYQPKSAAFVPALDNTYKYNVKKAKALMAAAGYSHGFSMTMPDLSFSATFEPAVKQQLAAIGIDVTFVPTTLAQFGAGLGTGAYPMVLTPDGYGTVPTDIVGTVSPTGSFNPFHTTNATIAGLLHKAQYATSDATRNATYAEISTYLVKNAWFAPIAYQSALTATVKGVNYSIPTENLWSQLRNFSDNPYSN